MDRREFLETIKEWEIDLYKLKEGSYDNYKFVKQMNLEEIAETGENILGDFLIKETNYNELSVKELINFLNGHYNGYCIDYQESEYIIMIIYLKIKNASYGELPQDIKLWKKYIEEYKTHIPECKNVKDILPLLLDKGCVEIFLGGKLGSSYSSYLSVDDIDPEKVANGIRYGSRLTKEDTIIPSELLYDERILSALVDTGQIDVIVEDNRIDNCYSFNTKKKNVDKTLKLHKFVPEIIKNLEEVNYNYKDFDVSRMKNFVLDEDYELINNAYLKYREDIKNIRVVPVEEKEEENISGRDMIINMLRDGIVTEDDLLEIIVDYRKEEKNIKKFKKVKNC